MFAVSDSLSRPGRNIDKTRQTIPAPYIPGRETRESGKGCKAWGFYINMDHFSFNAGYAIKYGVEEAIMIENLSYWIEKNAANNRHFHDGRFWTYNTAEAFTRLFPFWSAPQIRRIMKSLEEKGVIIVGEFNDSSYDRTKWYAFTDSFEQNRELDLTKSSTRSNGNERPIPSNYTNNNIPPSQTVSKDTICSTPDGEREPEINFDNGSNGQSPIPPPPSPKKDFSDKDFIEGLMKIGVEEQTAIDWVKQRKVKRLSNTKTALKSTVRELGKIPDKSPNELLEFAITKGWGGFMAEYYTNAIKKENANNKSDSALYDRIHESGEGRNYVSTL